MDKNLILNRLKEAKKITSETQFANFLGIKPSTLSSWRQRNSIDFEKLFANCEEISIDWLLTGKGDMLKNPPTNIRVNNSNANISGDNKNNVVIGNTDTIQGISTPPATATTPDTPSSDTISKDTLIHNLQDEISFLRKQIEILLELIKNK